jgi:nucleoside-diphosphate-sugar epimerase
MLRGVHDPAATQPVMQGDGQQSRDFTYIANAVEANLRALDASAGDVSGRVFNVACGESHTLRELYDTLAELTGYAQPPVFTEERTGDIRKSLASIDAARQAFGYTPRVGFREGLERTVEAYRKQLAAQATTPGVRS